MNKDVKQLVRSIEHIEGVEVRYTGSGHQAVYLNDKFVVTISSTPSDRRWRENTTALLRQAGITPANQPAGPAKPPVEIASVAELRKRIAAMPNKAVFARFLTEEMPKLQPGLRTYKTFDSASASIHDFVKRTNGGLSAWSHLLIDTAMREWDALVPTNGSEPIGEAELDKMITEAKEEDSFANAEKALTEKEMFEKAKQVQAQAKLASAGMVELARDHDDLTSRIDEMADRVHTLQEQLDEMLARRQAISDEILTRLDKAETRP